MLYISYSVMTIAMATSLCPLITLQIEEKLRGLRAAKDEEDLMNKIRECAPEIANITQLATLRQNVRNKTSHLLSTLALTIDTLH